MGDLLGEGHMFDGTTVIITGGSSGIGRLLARRLLDRGASLVLMARTENNLFSARDEFKGIASHNQRVEAFPCDVANPNAVEKAFQASVEAMGPPYILINSAGIIREGYFQRLSLETFREIMDTNFFGTLNCIRAVLPFFIQQGGGRIVNICSVAGFMGVFGYSAYCSSKHALAGLTSSLRVELKPQNIKFHLVCPPEFESPMAEELNKYRTPENLELARTLPVLKTDVVADAIMNGIEEDQYEIIPGLVARIARRIDAFLPWVSRKVMDYRLRKVYRGPAT
jgi:3-dehydrosphinganine reductase